MKFLILVLATISGCLAQNYCDSQWQCVNNGITYQHIACRTLTSQCTGPVSIMTIDATGQQLIVDSHNKLRDSLAGGGVKPFATAAGMTEMIWDQELANFATLLVKNCIYDHDKCHNTVAVPVSGQNLAKAATWGSDPTPTNQFLTDSMNGWWGENTACSQSILDKYPQSTGAVVGHFTVMAHKKNNRVGCAASTWKDSDGWQWYLLACNYGYTNMIGEAIYTSGTPKSACANGPSANYANLCK